MTHHITDEQIAELHDSMFPAPYDGHANVIRFARAVLALAAPQGQPVAWMWQHEETGRKGFVEAEQLAMGWEANNPRLKIISPLYTAPAPAVPSDERAVFEYEMRKRCDWGPDKFVRSYFQEDDYEDQHSQDAWEAWQARAALTAAPTPPAQTGIRAEFLDAHIKRTTNTVGRMVAETADQRGADAVAEFVRRAMQHVVSLIDATPPAQPAVPEDVARDAERYRWLRSRPLDWSVEPHTNGWSTCYGLMELDAAIDAARAAEKGGA